MNKLLLVCLGVSLAGCGDAIAQLKELGAEVSQNEIGIVTSLVLRSNRVTDATLVQLEEFNELQSLTLQDTQITDAGLVHLSKLKRLQLLNLSFTAVTDAGLVHLKGLTDQIGRAHV